TDITVKGSWTGPARLSLAAGGRFDRSMLATAAAGAPVVIVAAVQGRRWAIFAPAGSQIRDESELSVLLDLPAGRRFFSVAALPDDSPGTLALFARHAFAFVEQTRVEWRFDEAASRVQTRYWIETRAMDGGETVPLIALYPHQRDQRVGGVPEQPFRFASVRGSMSVIAAAQFETAIDWRGVLPLWPLAGEPAQSERLRSLLSGDLRRAPGLFGRMMGPGTYWTGKGLGAAGGAGTCSRGGTSQCRRGKQIKAHAAVTGPTMSKYSFTKGWLRPRPMRPALSSSGTTG
ncbi:MAG: hypothetical protein ACO27H_03060, partial [Burkholderiaceae bacterium]